MTHDPEASLAQLMDRIKPGSARRVPSGEPWEPPAFEDYEQIRLWLRESVLTATLFERYPDGRWTIEILLKEQVPGTVRTILL